MSVLGVGRKADFFEVFWLKFRVELVFALVESCRWKRVRRIRPLVGLAGPSYHSLLHQPRVNTQGHLPTVEEAPTDLHTA